MDIVIAFATFIGGLILGSLLAARGGLKNVRDVSDARAVDPTSYLHVLRRELANVLIWSNPQRYLRLHQELRAEIIALKASRPEAVKKRLGALCAKYPRYSDFDAIRTRDYVLYPDAVSMLIDDDIAARYGDLVIMGELCSIAGAVNASVDARDDEELAHLSSYVRRVEDTKLRLRLEQAIEHDALHRCHRAETGLKLEASTHSDHSIKPLPHATESRYGIHFKDTNEFGIVALAFEPGWVRYGYYRSDPEFGAEERLNPLNDVVEEWCLRV